MFELTDANSYLGHFLFTNGLMPLLKAAADTGSDVRILTIASNAVAVFLPSKYKPDFTDPQFYRGVVPPPPFSLRLTMYFLGEGDYLRYAVSKLATMMFASELQRRLTDAESPILSIAINPGAVDSNGTAPSMLKPWLRPMLKGITISEDEGSWNALFMGTAKEIRENEAVWKGRYVEPVGQLDDGHALMRDEEQRRLLWDATTSEINQYLQEQGRPLLEEW